MFYLFFTKEKKKNTTGILTVQHAEGYIWLLFAYVLDIMLKMQAYIMYCQQLWINNNFTFIAKFWQLLD